MSLSVEQLLALQRDGKLPAMLTRPQLQAISRSMARYSEFIGQDAVEELTGKLLEGVESILNPKQVEGVTKGATVSSLRGELTNLLAKFGDPQQLAGLINLDFKIETATSVAQGAQKLLRGQADVDEYPAWEFHRVYERDVPRGFRRGKGGTLIPVPDEAWDVRWPAAAEESGDEDALRVFEETGRMIALKDSPIWQALGDGAGGYTDTLGNPFPPFAFNSGYRWDGVPRIECIELGLLESDEEPKAAKIDVHNLFAIAA